MKVNALTDMKPLNLFFISASSFLVANNLHFIANNGFVPRILDLIGYLAIFGGIFLFFKK